MGSGGTEWETGDNFEPIRLNKKTIFVGTGEQATNLITSPQIGQEVFCTENDATFTHDKISVYSTSSAWVTPNLDEIAEAETGVQSTGASGSGTRKYYQFFTIPTTYKFYVITGLEYRAGATPGNVLMGVDIVNANPPTLAHSMLVALARQHTGSALNTLYRVNEISSKIIRGGTILGYWCQGAAGGAMQGNNLAGGYYKNDSYDATPEYANATAFTSGVEPPSMKVYYRGFS